MFTFLVIVTVLVFIALLLSAGVKLNHSEYSMFELQRRAKHSGADRAVLAREKLLPKVEALFATKVALFLSLTVILLIVTFGWAVGVILAILVAVLYRPLAHTKKVSQLSSGLYKKLESKNIAFIKKFPKTFDFISEGLPSSTRKVDSREELQDMITHSVAALTDIERQVIVNALEFNDKKVSTIMTVRKEIDTIKKDEFLGPLVLDELHTIGHSRLPVIDKDIDHIVGVLHLDDLLSLDVKRSATVEKLMDSKVVYIHKDETLEQTLAMFLKARNHLLIVIDDAAKTVGLVTLEDTVEALIGRRLTSNAE